MRAQLCHTSITRPVALALGALLSLFAAPATAGGRAERACAAIRPAQQLTTARAVELEGALTARLPGLVTGSAEGSRVEREEAAVTLLSGDELAKAWTIFQLCVLKEEGTITAATHDQLLREVIGGSPATTSPSTVPNLSAAPITEPVDGFVAQADTATLIVVACPHRVARGTTPAVRGLVHWQINGRGLSRGPATAFALDLPPGRVSVAARYTSLRDQLEFSTDAGQIYAITVDWSFSRIGLLTGMDVRPVAPGALSAHLGLCLQRERIAAKRAD